MSYPYHYVDYSNPSTPHVYAWELEQGPPAQIPLPQALHPQAQAQALQDQQQQQEHAQQPPQQPQPQQQDQHRQSQQSQHPAQQQTAAYRAPATIQLQERAAPASQYRFDNITEEHFLQAAADETRSDSSSRRGASKPPLRASVSPTASSAGGVGPSRVAHGRNAQHAHPYRRPPSAASSPSAASAVRVRTESEMPQQMLPSPQAQAQLQLQTQAQAQAEAEAEAHAPLQARPSTSAGGIESRSLSSVASAATIPAIAVSCPAAQSWRDRIFKGPGRLAEETSPALGGAPTPREPLRRYIIRTDVHFDAAENTLTAMLELPGVRRADLRITLATCPYSRVRQLVIAGTARPVLPVRGHAVQERKFGEFARTLVVPPGTEPEDVHATMEDGILMLKIPGGHPADAQQSQEVAIL